MSHVPVTRKDDADKTAQDAYSKILVSNWSSRMKFSSGCPTKKETSVGRRDEIVSLYYRNLCSALNYVLEL